MVLFIKECQKIIHFQTNLFLQMYSGELEKFYLLKGNLEWLAVCMYCSVVYSIFGIF